MSSRNSFNEISIQDGGPRSTAGGGLSPCSAPTTQPTARTFSHARLNGFRMRLRRHIEHKRLHSLNSQLSTTLSWISLTQDQTSLRGQRSMTNDDQVKSRLANYRKSCAGFRLLKGTHFQHYLI